MKQTVLSAAIILCLGITACTRHSDTQAIADKAAPDKNAKMMKNLISIVEIPTDSFARAVRFYQSILEVSIEAIDMQGTQMGLFPCDKGTVNVALVGGNDYKPSQNGTLAYLNGGEDLQHILDKVASNGGKVMVPKTRIDAENGFFAVFIDTEGNKVGLHSYQ